MKRRALPRFPVLPSALRAVRLAPPAGPVDLVIDSDAGNEIDDQFAIAWALRRPDRLRIHGFTACPFGLSPELLASGAMLAELDARRFERRLAAAGVDLSRVPRLEPAEGVRRAVREIGRVLSAAGEPAEGRVHAGASRFLASEAEPVESDAARFLVETARALRPAALHLAAIGCLTNVASALLLAPDLVESLVVTWTAAYPSFWPHANASYNLAQDLHAARVVLASGVPLVYLPGYYVGEELRATRPEIAAALAGRGGLADHLHALFERHLGASDAPGKSKVLWDLVAVAWLLEPAWFATHVVGTPALAADLRWTPRDGPGHPMREALDVDRDAVFTDLYRSVAGPETPRDLIRG